MACCINQSKSALELSFVHTRCGQGSEWIRGVWAIWNYFQSFIVTTHIWIRWFIHPEGFDDHMAQKTSNAQPDVVAVNWICATLSSALQIDFHNEIIKKKKKKTDTWCFCKKLSPHTDTCLWAPQSLTNPQLNYNKRTKLCKNQSLCRQRTFFFTSV